jgi:hypothetical protein
MNKGEKTRSWSPEIIGESGTSFERILGESSMADPWLWGEMRQDGRRGRA